MPESLGKLYEYLFNTTDKFEILEYDEINEFDKSNEIYVNATAMADCYIKDYMYNVLLDCVNGKWDCSLIIDVYKINN